MMERPQELCSACGFPTCRAGFGEDSIEYVDGLIGPFCESCNEQLRQEIKVKGCADVQRKLNAAGDELPGVDVTIDPIL
jgi:hypothetical protein